MSKIYNFSAGPATIYQEVLSEIQKELLDYKGMGYSLVEASHRGKVYSDIHAQAAKDMKDLLGLGDDYEVLFLGGGATLQFAMLAYNFLSSDKVAHYIHTGSWAKAAIRSAKKIGKVEILYDGSEHNFTTLPDASLSMPKESAYVHLTSNETIGGIQWKEFPSTGDVPLVADMSSDILSRQFDAKKFSLIYAGAQKNLGPAGATVVIIKKAFLEAAQEPDSLPDYLSYKLQAEKNSMLNTPPVFPIWVLGSVLKHIKSLGGVAAVEKKNDEKASILYEYIDTSDGFYSSPVDAKYRSYMNVVFRLPSEELDATFVAEAKSKGLEGLKGHRSVGGCRASIYNAMTKKGVLALVDFMKDFRKRNG